jgi:hypothetical protein
VNLIFGFGVHNHHDFAPQQTQSHPAPLAVILTIILEGKGRASKDQRSVSESKRVSRALFGAWVRAR